MNGMPQTTGPIRDQRVMVGPDFLATVEEVEDAWQNYADENGLAIRARRGDNRRDLRPSKKTVVAFVSGSKWIAQCPSCNGGIACWTGNPRGCCLDCGTIYRVNHPTPDEIARAEQLLSERKRETDRNWHRHQGETLDQLAEENERLAETDAYAALETGVVHASDIARIFGDKALDKLRREGVL